MRVALTTLGVLTVLSAQVNVVTANYGNDRTNTNTSESLLNTTNVSPDSFGKIGAFPVDGQIYTQPLFVSGLQIDGEARNVIFVATMRNSLYAIDADQPASSTPIWKANFGTPVTSEFLDFDDIEPEVGILSTPVIDLSRNTIFFVTDTFERGNSLFRLHAVDLSTGKETSNPVEIKATVTGVGDGTDGTNVAFDPKMHLQRPGLLLANDRIYVAFGSHADTFPYHGWIMAYDAGNISKQVAVFNTTPNGSSGSIWQSGRGLAADADGNIYAGTGNGDYDGETSFSESFLKLSPDLKLIDWYTPFNWKRLSERDQDMGSLGPMLVPGTGQVLGGDKFGDLFLMNSFDMGRLDSEESPKAQVFRPIIYGGFFTTALWSSEAGLLVYALQQGDWTAAFRITDGKFEAEPIAKMPFSSDVPYQGMAISALGSSADTGILWMTTGNYEQDDVPGILRAFKATDLTEIWSSETNPDRDRPGRFAKFVAPTIVNGRVYVPTFSNSLAIYGLVESSTPALEPEPEPTSAIKAKRPVRAGQYRATPARANGGRGQKQR